jgi:hypothetical protein
MICEKCKNRIFDHVCIDICEERVCPNRYGKNNPVKEIKQIVPKNKK